MKTNILLLTLSIILLSCNTEKNEWKKAKNINTFEAYDNYFKKYPNSTYLGDLDSDIREKVKFKKELEENFEKLYDNLNSLQNSSYSDFGINDPKYDDEKSPGFFATMVVKNAQDIRNQFGKVSIAFLDQEIDSFDKWSIDLETFYRNEQNQIEKKITEFKKHFLANESDYQNIFGKCILVSSNQKDIGFKYGNSYYLVKDIIDIDYDIWREDIKQKISNFHL